MSTKHFFTNRRFRKRIGRDPETRVMRYEWVVVRVDVELDLDTIFGELGEKALHNRSKKSKALGGALRVSVSKELKA